VVERGAIEVQRRPETDDLRGEARQLIAAIFFLFFSTIGSIESGMNP
jgi:hypothetical protein